ncbi:MAG: Uma2 family endonuclease [Chloroflexi bacterium]|nr:Uma2 family endonuclease [Chloroflexota bacterium]
MPDVTALPIETAVRWTIADLESYPIVEGNRYEIIEGELLVSTQPHVDHQEACNNFAFELTAWVRAGGGGRVIPAPGVIFDPENAVAPDIVWVSGERAPHLVGEDGKLHDAPELVVEVLSPGAVNTRRDREAKLRLYSVRGVREYWIADWQAKSLQVYRREGAALKLAATLYAGDELTSSLLPGFKVPVARLFPA